MKKKWIKFKYVISFFPLRINFFLLMGLGLVFYFYLFKTQNTKEETIVDSLSPLVSLLAKMALGIFLVLVLVSAVSTILVFLYYRKNRNNESFHLKLQHLNDENNILTIAVKLKTAFRPLLGYVSGRLQLQGFDLSDSFVLASTHFRKNSLKVDEIYGENLLTFPDIKEYQIKGTVIYFEDMLRLLRLPVVQKMNTSFYNPPKTTKQDSPEVQPQSTKDMEVRIKEVRRVEGELFNYKQFEYGDDVRRIVWKIYGKNRELIIRHAEMRNPFASKLEIYASFHNGLATFIPETNLANAFLNVYKNAVWSLYISLVEKNEWELHYISEQKIISTIEDIEERTAYEIAQSKWQEHTGINTYFNLKNGTVFCIHSLTNIEDLKLFINNGGADKMIYFIPLSELMEKSKYSFWKRLFFLEDALEEGEGKLKTEWLLSPLRIQMLKNEALILKLLKAFSIDV
ncbi:MAG TPA: hypothetical protein PKX92_00555 [Edaphocola sp.]|nr:hypothetical protein [Edaphocola sp.]